MSWIRHAFALDEGKSGPTSAQKDVVDKVCREVVRRGLTTPALISLEVFRPMNYIGAQTMHFFRPFVTILLDGEGYRHFSEFLEKRESVEYMRRRIEELEDQNRKIETKQKKARGGTGKPGNPSP